MNDLYHQAREAVARAELLSLAAETDIQREAVQKEISRAKTLLSNAFDQLTPAEQDQLMVMQEHLQSIGDFDSYL
ncbi:DUF3813 family protein [Halalkalibacter urbisdiaboli]|uniref:DUF3813 family protein n=1 Tax=Halalkalibacter urbisdiaboli TaxID=1960589 RepID=UPI000B43CCD7|nr:DUF3813 family protein [Halalkalibacter urbisdiaboli]